MPELPPKKSDAAFDRLSRTIGDGSLRLNGDKPARVVHGPLGPGPDAASTPSTLPAIDAPPLVPRKKKFLPGSKSAVVIDLRRHGELWEDVYDNLVPQERIGEPRESLEQVRQRFVKSGKLPRNGKVRG